MSAREPELDELESGLRRLFDDERLAVRPAPGATSGVLAGARRARRRRELAIAGSGVVAAAAVVGGVLIGLPSSGQGNELAAPPNSASLLPGAPSTSSSASPTPKKTPPTGNQTTKTSSLNPSPTSDAEPPPQPRSDEPEPPNMPMIFDGPVGPSGWDKLTLGMSFEDAKATGFISADAAPPEGCTSYAVTAGTEYVSVVLISESGLGRIVAAAEGRTPEGKGIGSPIEELKQAYPEGTEDESSFTATNSAGGTYQFGMGEDAVAHSFALTNGGC